MSYATITQASQDVALHDRTVAAVHKEALGNPQFGDTAFGAEVLAGTADVWTRYAYPVAVDTEAAYESAVIADNPDPGGDPAVITDAAILAAVQAHWPPDPS